MKKVSIYLLSCPIEKTPMYIGKTGLLLEKRLQFHFNDLRLNGKKNKWVRELKSRGLKPLISEVDSVKESEWMFWEQYWISQFKAWGFNLTNNSIGGYGATGVKHEGVALENIRLGAKKRVEKERKLGIIKNPFKNKTEQEIKTIQLKAHKTRLKNGGYIISEETKLKISAFHKGKKLSDEHKKKLSDFRKKAGIHPETRKKCREATSKTVVQIDLNGIIVGEWFNVPVIVKKFGFNNSALRKAIHRGSVFNNFNWKYK